MNLLKQMCEIHSPSGEEFAMNKFSNIVIKFDPFRSFFFSLDKKSQLHN